VLWLVDIFRFYPSFCFSDFSEARLSVTTASAFPCLFCPLFSETLTDCLGGANAAGPLSFVAADRCLFRYRGIFVATIPPSPPLTWHCFDGQTARFGSCYTWLTLTPPVSHLLSLQTLSPRLAPSFLCCHDSAFLHHRLGSALL
jgi:hypothetical protein